MTGLLARLLGGLVLAGLRGAAVALLRRARPGRRDPAAVPLPAGALSREDVQADVRQRAAVERWDGPLRRLRRARVPGLARLRGLLRPLAPLAAGLFVAFLFGTTALLGVTGSGATAVATAQVLGPAEGLVTRLVGDVEVSFPVAGGGTVTTAVAVTRLPDPPPRTLRVRYDVEDPQGARSLQHDGTATALLVAGACAVAGLAGAVVAARSAGRARALRRAVLAAPGRTVPYALAVTGDGLPVLLLLDAHRPPWHALVLAADPRGRLAATGTAEVRGPCAEGAAVAVVLRGREVATGSALLVVDDDDVRSLLPAPVAAVVG